MTGTAFNREIFARLWNDHSVPTARIAAAMGLTRQGVSWHARKLNLPGRDKLRRKLYEETTLRDMWLAGVKASEIAKHFGMAHHACASTAARKLGLPRRQRGPSGKMNGGWPATISLTEYFEAKAAARLAVVAAREQAALINAEMVDTIGYRLCGAIHATRATVDIVGARP